MCFLDLICALDVLNAGEVEPSPAELQARREKARRLAMMQRPASGLATGPA